MQDSEKLRVERNCIPLVMQSKYNLQSFAKNGATLIEVRKGLFGLPQARKLAQDHLVAHLATHRYKQADHTPCLFSHETRDLQFTLVVDDFGHYS
jgi:hypothetical protein